MEKYTTKKAWWVESRRALVCWGLLGAILGGVIVNSATGFGATLSKIVHENEMVDKVAHLIFFGVLSFLIHRGLRLHLRCATWMVVALGSLIACGLGALDEWSQLWIAGRNFDYSDMWANFLGAGLIGPFGCLVIEDKQPSIERTSVALEEAEVFQGGKKSRRSAFISSSPKGAERKKMTTGSGHRRRGVRIGMTAR